MEYSFAPMEGITGYLFRNAHHQVFPEVDTYYMPFAAPNMNHSFSPKELRDMDPEHNRGLHVVPQLLTSDPDYFIKAARELAAMGYGEVNLNVGCPSQTVVTKGKGAGMLRDVTGLEEFLDRIFQQTPIAVSVKTRLGIVDEEEYEAIGELYNKYPISVLILHPRVQKDFYKAPARRDAFVRAYERCKHPMVYNGDLWGVSDCREVERKFPDLQGLMLGRGLLRNPGLITELKTGNPTAKEQIQQFHDLYYRAICEQGYGDKQTLCKMKELWDRLIQSFPDSDKYAKQIRKCNRAVEYEAVVNGVFRDLEFQPNP